MSTGDIMPVVTLWWTSIPSRGGVVILSVTSCYRNRVRLRQLGATGLVKTLPFRAVFNWVSKVISQLLWFCIATVCDWLKNLAPLFFDQSEVKPKPIVTCLYAFSRAWRRLHVFASSSDWFIGLFTTDVIGQSNYFGFGITTLNWKPL